MRTGAAGDTAPTRNRPNIGHSHRSNRVPVIPSRYYTTRGWKTSRVNDINSIYCNYYRVINYDLQVYT